MLNKHQVKWYFEETFNDHWEEITYFLNTDTETKELMIKDIQEQTKGRHYKPMMKRRKKSENIYSKNIFNTC